MGTQQLLLIVLGVIIVGIAIAVGITIFNNQAYNANRSAIASEAQTYGSDAMQYWKTPVSQGGAGKNPANINVESLSEYMNFDYTPADPGDPGADPPIPPTPAITGYLSTDTGNYQVASATGTTVIIVGVGKEKRGDVYPKVITTVNLEPGTVSAVTSTADALTDFTYQ